MPRALYFDSSSVKSHSEYKYRTISQVILYSSDANSLSSKKIEASIAKIEVHQ